MSRRSNNVGSNNVGIVRKLVGLTPAKGLLLLLLVLVEGLINASVQGLSIWGTKWLTDLALGDNSAFQRLSVWTIVLTLCATVALYFLNSCIGVIFVAAQGKLRRKIIRSLFSERLFIHHMQPGDIANRYSVEVEEATKLLDSYVRGNVLAICSIVMSFVFGAMLDWRLLILTLVAGLFILVLSMFFSKPLSNTANAFYSKQSAFMDKMIKMAHGITQIRVFPLHTAFHQDMHNLNDEVVKTQGHMKTRYLLVENCMEICMALFRVLFISIGIYMVHRNLFSVSVLLASQQASMMIMGSIGSVGSLFSLQQRSITTARRVLDLIEQDGSEGQRDNESADAGKESVIAVDDICFAWQEGNQVFDHFSFDLQAGKCVQIVGKNGSGKSTLIRLILGLYKPQSGKVFLLHTDTNNQSTIEKKRKEEIGYVSQIPQFLEGSVRENIVGFSIYFDEKWLMYITTVLGIEKQLNTVINTTMNGDMRDSGGLSGGEMQLISVARAVYKKPLLLILDEPTSAMDLVSQACVEKLVREQKEKGSAILLVSHREKVFESIVDSRLELFSKK